MLFVQMASVEGRSFALIDVSDGDDVDARRRQHHLEVPSRKRSHGAAELRKFNRLAAHRKHEDDEVRSAGRVDVEEELAFDLRAPVSEALHADDVG
jgi:hypothetical protein